MKKLIGKTTTLSNLKDIERAEKNAANFIKSFLMENLIGKTTILSNLKDIERAEKNPVNFIKSFIKENFSDIKILRSTKEGDFVFSKVTMVDGEEHFLKSKTDIKKIDYKITVSVSLVDLEEVPKRLLK